MKQNFYCSRVLLSSSFLLLLLTITSSAFSITEALASNLFRSTITSNTDELTPGVLAPFQEMEPPVLYDWEVYETNVTIYWTNVNPDSQTEIYRSTSPDSGYELIATGGNDTEGYSDRDLAPRTMYYYRLRAVRGNETSDYLEVEIETLSKNYPPTLTAHAVNSTTVELTFTDNSFNDLNYYVHVKDNPNAFGEVLEMPDSGRTVTLTHSGATPGTTYTYTVDLYADISPREGQEYPDIVQTSATTPANTACEGAGSIKREFWWNFTSTDLSTIPVSTAPDKVATMTNFETPNYQGNNYASRVRGYICPPATGNYTFYLASDDQAQLFLSTNASASGKVKIAEVTGSTTKNQFNKYPSQTSQHVQLVSGTLYYVEVLHRDGGGADFIQVAWTLPGTQHEVPIPGTRLIPFDYEPEPEPVACSNTGKIEWEIWRNFTGGFNSFPYNNLPSTKVELTKFETPQYYGTSYASRIRGYICPPQTGDYVFSLASDDMSRLFLSSDEVVSNKQMIAEVPGATKYNQWDKYPSQTSAAVRLEQGRKYYIEVIHIEGSGNDFIQVGWKLPGGTLQRPIPGANLMPYTGNVNENPVVSITEPASGSSYSAPANIAINANASDPDGRLIRVEFFNGSTKLGEDYNAPYEFVWGNVSSGNYTIRVVASDDAGGTAEDTATITVSTPACASSGRIYREVWFEATGSTVADIPVNNQPHYWEYLTSLETPQYWANNYGSRIRGYLCVPVSGNYRFMISSDDQSQLALSTNEDPANKVIIASVTGNSGFRNFTKYPQQKSVLINLVQGNRYYIEVLHKEANGNDHVTVGWEMPNGSTEVPIGGNRLIAIGDDATLAAANFSEAQIVAAPETSDDFTVYPNPVTTRNFVVSLSRPSGIGEAKIQIVSTKGDVIMETVQSCGECSEIPVTLDDKVEAGLYLISVYEGRKRSSKKLLVK